MTDPDRWVWPWLADNRGRFFPRDGMWLAIAACFWLHAPGCQWPYLFDQRKSCAAVHCMMPSFCICTPSKELGLIMRLYAPKKEVRYKYLHKIDRLKVEIVHILVIITAVTQNHGNCRKSRHRAKITVITATVNSWFTYIPIYNIFGPASCALDRVDQWSTRRSQ